MWIVAGAWQIQVLFFGTLCNFFYKCFDLELIEPTDAEPADMEDQLYFPLLKF